MTRTPEQVAGRIQHTEVSPTADQDRIEELCEECIEYGFDGAMVQACWAPLARDRLADTDVTVSSAVGFPMGGDRPISKAAAIRDAVAAGAEEVDVMPNIGFVKSGRFEAVGREMDLIVEASGDATVKAMLELGALDDDEAERVVELAVDAGFDYVKNSSGWGEGGTATVERIEFLRERAPEDVKVKASGGIKTLAGANELLDAGADLLGASSGVEIVTGAVGDGEY
ncbi:deoxyribose-phosphate aldolase [Halosimplex carlsbadense 2-9-1]|uniref:Deoxyribose-phosphate aldolase n=1 Tax=Halosimplex carlsbadense 2-9-1 TaxID=797114 RepID=M0CGH0_9EURY|nr:deoxyribose-phosphate aldolase [Halosimplex carlsbadense]ELZ22351.1 deoxyribose-phosphate aldolase [Halosimplex carlsbadense 2-9-1]